ncbi:MAG: AsmA family protein [Desulfovibrio sp.]|nr:AsmA family protein [Desulfovibrio sp.]
MKRILLLGSGIAALLIVSAIVAISQIDADFMVKRIAEITEQTTGKALVCETVPDISFFPPGLSLGRTRWGEISEGRGMAATMKSGVIALELMPLLSGNVVVREIRLDNPVFEMRGSGDVPPTPDKIGAASDGGGKNSSSDAVSPAAPPNFPADLPVELERMVLRQGEVVWDDGSGKRAHIKNINLSVENLRRGGDASIQCDFAFDFVQNKADNLSGTLALDTKIRYKAAVLNFRQSSVTITPLGGRIPKDAGPVQFAGEGVFDFHKQALRLTSLRLALPHNVKIQGDLALLLEKAISVTGKIQAGVVPVDSYLALLKDPAPSAAKSRGTSANKTANAAAGAERKSPSTEEVSWPTVDMQISVSGVQYGKLAVNDIAFGVKGENGKYALTSLNCALGTGGVLRGQADINMPDKGYAAKLTARGINIGNLLEALHKGRPAEGTADLNADVSIRGRNSKELMASLNGGGLFEARDVRVAALSSLPQAIPGISALAAPLQLVRVPFAARNGEVTAQPVTVTSQGIDAKGRALASLPKEHLDATASVRLLGLNLPVYAKGPFSSLSYGLDPKFTLPGVKSASDALSSAGKAVGDTAKKGKRGAEGLVKGLFGR